MKRSPNFGKAYVKRLLVIGGSAFGILLVSLCSVYAIAPEFERTSIRLPSKCNGLTREPRPPMHLRYSLPDGKGTAILLSRSDGTAVVAAVANSPAHPSNVYIIDTGADRVLNVIPFPNDVIMAGLSGGIIYLYNDKLGYFFDARTGTFEKNLLVADNYGGLSNSDRPVIGQSGGNTWYIETTAVVTSVERNGSIHSLVHVVFDAIARGCFVDGKTGSITRL